MQRSDRSHERAIDHLAAVSLRELDWMPVQSLLLRAAETRGLRAADYLTEEVEFVLEHEVPCPPQEVSPSWMKDTLVGLALIEQNRHN